MDNLYLIFTGIIFSHFIIFLLSELFLEETFEKHTHTSLENTQQKKFSFRSPKSFYTKGGINAGSDRVFHPGLQTFNKTSTQ